MVYDNVAAPVAEAVPADPAFNETKGKGKGATYTGTVDLCDLRGGGGGEGQSKGKDTGKGVGMDVEVPSSSNPGSFTVFGAAGATEGGAAEVASFSNPARLPSSVRPR